MKKNIAIAISIGSAMALLGYSLYILFKQPDPETVPTPVLKQETPTP